RISEFANFVRMTAKRDSQRAFEVRSKIWPKNYLEGNRKWNKGIISVTGIVEDKEKICWRVTRRCNLKFLHCLAGHPNQFRRDLATEEQLTGLESIIRSGVRRITWTGGEPTLCKNLPQLLRICHTHQVQSAITTHGLSLQERFLRVVDPQLDSLRFSFDG